MPKESSIDNVTCGTYFHKHIMAVFGGHKLSVLVALPISKGSGEYRKPKRDSPTISNIL